MDTMMEGYEEHKRNSYAKVKKEEIIENGKKTLSKTYTYVNGL